MNATRNTRPQAGVHYPRLAGEFRAWFATDDDCLDYLEWLRWPQGFVCPWCAHPRGWALSDGGYRCASCGRRTAVTAGTIFDRRRTPLTVWFEACWMFSSGKDGMSALSLQRSLQIGSYPTAWAMLHRLRSVLVRPGRDRLTGTVEVDETYIGGKEPGLRGGRAKGKKALVGVAVEINEPRGFGRARMAILADGSATSLRAFLTEHVEPGARVITDGWTGYQGIDTLGYTHEPRNPRAARARGEDPGEAAAGGPSCGLVGQGMATGHASRLGRRGAPAELPRRVRLPLQPAPVSQPRHRLLPGARTCRHPCPSALPGVGRQPPIEADTAFTAGKTRAPADHGQATRGSTMASILNR